MAYHGGEAPYIVGYAGSLKQVAEKTVLKDIAPELMDAEETVHGQSDLNIEEIIKLKPDVIFYNATNKDRYEALSKSGIPCVGFATIGTLGKADPIERYGQWLTLLEDVFDEKGKTADFKSRRKNRKRCRRKNRNSRSKRQTNWHDFMEI